MRVYSLCINTSSTILHTACDNYTWPANNQTYSSSGAYTATLTNAAGCDSIATLNLTINQSTSGSESVTACDSFIWSANGQTYTFSGTYLATLTNAAGCDSIATLNLTINQRTSGSESVTACDSYTWPVNNQTYTQSGQYTEILTNAFGCDSTVTLNLTIVVVDITTQPVDQTVVVGNKAEFVATTSATNPTYQWQMKNSTGYMDLVNTGQFTSANTDKLTVHNVALAQNNTLFRCVVTENFICSDTTDVALLTVKNNVGINETSLDKLFSVFPNPTQSVINVKSEDKLIGSGYSIYDNTGRVVLTGNLILKTQQLN